MAKTDIMGLLTGVSSQGIDPMASASFRERQLQLGAETAKKVQGAVRGLFNVGPTAQEQIQTKMTEGVLGFETKPLEEQKRLIKALQLTGQTALAGQLASSLEQNKKLQLNKQIVERFYPNNKWASDFAAQGVPLSIIKELTSDTNADRDATYNWVVDTYGKEEADKLKPVIMTGQVKPKDIPSLIPDDSMSISSRQNVDYIDSDGNKQTILIQFGADGKTYDSQGKPIKIPTNSQISVVGRTEADVTFEQQEDGTLGAPLSKSDRQKIIDDINGSISLLNEVENIGTEELENTLTYLGKAKRWTGGVSSSLQIGKLAESENKILQAIGEKAENLEDFGGESTVIFDKLQQYFNKRRHDITGAQASIKELAELRKGLLSGGSKPNQAKARIAEIIRRERASIARNQMLLENNMMSWDSYTGTSTLPSEDNEEQEAINLISIIDNALGIEPR